MRLACAALLLLAVACDNGDTCNTAAADVAEVCLPATVAPDLPVVVQVRELCGNTCSGLPDCSALYRNATVFLDFQQETCSSQLGTGCIQAGCRSAAVRCVLPALAPGDYPLRIPGGPSRMLHVVEGGASSCRFTSADGGVE